MSIIGTKIFSDEYAALVRDEYRVLVGFGFPDAEVEKLVIEYFIGDDDKSETAGIFWLALALSQWNVGRLSEYVRQKAIDVIDSGLDLKKWERAIQYETVFSQDKNVYNFTLISDVMAQKQMELASATGIDRVKKVEEMQNLKELCAFCTEESDIAMKAQPIPRVVKDDPYLFDILMVNGKARKKYQQRKDELQLLRSKLLSSQTFKKVAKPYYTTSPWDEGDIVTMKLKGLSGDAARLNDHWVMFPVLDIKRNPVSGIVPQLATNDEIIVGLYNFININPPNQSDLQRAQYIPFRIIKDEDTRGIQLNLYGGKKELLKWQWQVQVKQPDFTKELPKFYQSGSIGMVIISFGDEFANDISHSLLASN